MTTSPTRVASRYLSAADGDEAVVWLPDYLGPAASAVGPALRLAKEITKGTPGSTTHGIVGGLFYESLRDHANLERDAVYMRKVLDRGGGLSLPANLWQRTASFFNGVMRGMSKGNKAAMALRLAGVAVELLMKTNQRGKAKIVNDYFVGKYGDELATMQPSREEAVTPQEALRDLANSENVQAEAKMVASLLNYDKNKAMAFIAALAQDVNFSALARTIKAPVPLTDIEAEEVGEVAGALQYGLEDVSAFGVALLEEVRADELAAKFEAIVLKLGKSIKMFTERLGGDAYKGNPNGQAIYPNEIDHGYGEPLAGGTDVMRRLQNQFLHEQGRDPRPESPKVAAESPVRRRPGLW